METCEHCNETLNRCPCAKIDKFFKENRHLMQGFEDRVREDESKAEAVEGNET